MLREVARVLRETSREIDEPARYGGEEMARRAARRPSSRARTSSPSASGARIEDLGCRCSTAGDAAGHRLFGAAALPRSADGDKDALIAAADAALYGPSAPGRTGQSGPSRLSGDGMGLLDDAIREHLDLKRRRGADPAEIDAGGGRRHRSSTPVLRLDGSVLSCALG